MSAALARVERECVIAAIGFDAPAPRAFRVRVHVRMRCGHYFRFFVQQDGSTCLIGVHPSWLAIAAAGSA